MKRTKSAGFIQAIVILIIILVVASFYGYGPQVIWSDYLAPIFIFIWNIIVAIVNFLVGLIKTIIGAVKTLFGMVN